MAQDAMQTAALRRRIYEILERGSLADPVSWIVDRLIILLIVGNLIASTFESMPRFGEPYALWFALIEGLTVIVFTAEYALRLWLAAENPSYGGRNPTAARLDYAKSPTGLVDLFSVLPFWLSFLIYIDPRVLLVLRFIRFFKLARYSPSVKSLLDVLYTERRSLFGCFVILLGTAIVAASLIHLVEREAQPDEFGTIPHALWWAVLLLGGYGEFAPITPLGRLVASVAIFLGVMMVALPVGIIATAFANEIKRRDFIVTWSMVAKVPLFAKLDAAEIADITRLLRAHSYEPGAIILRRGDHGDSMFFVASGEVEVELPKERVRLGVGDFFGEMAVLQRVQRTANVVAATRAHLLILEGQDLRALMMRHPAVAAPIERVMQQRVRAHQIAASPAKPQGRRKPRGKG